MKELIFDRQQVHDALKRDLRLRTTKVVSLPEGDAELPDEGLPDEIQDDEPESEDGEGDDE